MKSKLPTEDKPDSKSAVSFVCGNCGFSGDEVTIENYGEEIPACPECNHVRCINKKRRLVPEDKQHPPSKLDKLFCMVFGHKRFVDVPIGKGNGVCVRCWEWKGNREPSEIVWKDPDENIILNEDPIYWEE